MTSLSLLWPCSHNSRKKALTCNIQYPQTKWVIFHYHKADHEFSPVMMNGWTLHEFLCLECLLGLKFIPDLKWNLYRRSIPNEVGKMVGFLYGFRKYLTPWDMLYLCCRDTCSNFDLLPIGRKFWFVRKIIQSDPLWDGINT